MKAEITKRCSVICEPGSIVEVSESQFQALGDFAKKYKAPVKSTEEKSEPAKAKTTKKKEA